MLIKLFCLALLACGIVNCCILTNSTTNLSDKLIDESVRIKSELIDSSSSSVNEISINNKLNSTEKLTISNEVNNEKPLICYYGTWAVYRPGDGKFNVEDIDVNVCTHLVYAFAGLSYNNEIISLDSWNDLPDNYGKNAFGRFTGLKKKNEKLKTILAIGGWNEGSIKYSNMAKSDQSRKTFANSVVNMLEKYNFDGLDLDWEYPANRGGSSADKENYIKLIAELKEAFKPKGYLLTAAVSAGHWTIDTAYDIPNMSKYLDYINIMAYDFHGAWDQKTGHNSPLYQRSDESGNEAKLNVDFAIKYWIEKGAAKEKLILGMGTYGRTFTLGNSNQNGYNAPITGPGAAGPYTREASTLGYNEFCEVQTNANGDKWTIVQDKTTKVPYAYKSNQWIGYDDIASVNEKARYVRENGLGGAMIWSIETDDFRGKCGNGKFPLLVSIRKGLNGEVVQNPDSSTPLTPTTTTTSTQNPSSTTSTSSSTTTTTTTTTTTPSTTSSSTESSSTESSSTSTESSSTTAGSSSTSTTTQSSSDKFVCKEEGFFRKKDDCAIFYRCVYVGEFGEDGQKYRTFEYRCPAGTVFDEVQSLCLWPSAVKGCENYYGDSNHI